MDASADEADFTSWRAVATARRLPVDALLATLLEWSAVAGVSGVEVSAILDAAMTEIRTPRLPPTDDLRTWERQLEGRGPAPDVDELPELCLPLRVVVSLGHRRRIAEHIDMDMVDDALLVDRAACRHGLTTESWVLRTALARA